MMKKKTMLFFWFSLIFHVHFLYEFIIVFFSHNDDNLVNALKLSIHRIENDSVVNI